LIASPTPKKSRRLLQQLEKIPTDYSSKTDQSEVKRLIFAGAWSRQPGGIDLDEQVREA
jgi:hypothetical protein